MACETFGGLSRSCIELIDSLIYCAPDQFQRAYRTKSQLRGEMFGAVAVAAALVNGNLKLYRQMRTKQRQCREQLLLGADLTRLGELATELDRQQRMTDCTAALALLCLIK